MLGDLVNTTGTVQTLVSAFPETSFTLEGGPPADQIGLVAQEVWTRSRHAGLAGRLKRVARWRRGGFGACIILDDGHTHARLARLAGIPTIYGIHKGKPELFTEAVSFDPDGHDVFIQHRNLLTLLGLPNPDLKPILRPSLGHESAASVLFEELGGPEILIHTGASDPSKTWPDAQWEELMSGVSDARVAVIGGPGEDPKRFGLPTPSRPVAILEYAALLSKVRILITPDTGPAHLAAAMGTPTVVLYGPTDPTHFHPWPNGNQTLLYKDRGCRHYGAGCAHRSQGACTRICTTSITPVEVLAAVHPR